VPVDNHAVVVDVDSSCVEDCAALLAELTPLAPQHDAVFTCDNLSQTCVHPAAPVGSVNQKPHQFGDHHAACAVPLPHVALQREWHVQPRMPAILADV